jgi:hypothetical protein
LPKIGLAAAGFVGTAEVSHPPWTAFVDGELARAAIACARLPQGFQRSLPTMTPMPSYLVYLPIISNYVRLNRDYCIRCRIGSSRCRVDVLPSKPMTRSFGVGHSPPHGAAAFGGRRPRCSAVLKPVLTQYACTDTCTRAAGRKALRRNGIARPCADRCRRTRPS